MELSPIALVLLGLLLAAWTFGAAWLVISAQARARQAKAARANARRLSRMIDDFPAVPLLVRPDGKIEGPDRLAAWLGLDSLPEFLSELDAGGAGLAASDLDALREAVRRTQKTASPFTLALSARGSGKSLAIRGHLADPAVAPNGAALLWWFDFSDSQAELTRLRTLTTRARSDFAALVGLIEAAPYPMWFRGPDLALRLT